VLEEFNNDATNGDARVVGSGYAYFLAAPAVPPATDAPGHLVRPLSYADIGTHRVDAAAPTFKFPAMFGAGAMPGTVQYLVTARGGVVTSNRPGESPY